MEVSHMARVWQSTVDVDRAVETIAKYMREVGFIPQVLLEAYRESAEKTSRGLAQRFYEKLASDCPEAMRFF